MNQNDGRDIILEIGQVISGVLMAVDSLWLCVAPSGSCPTSSGLCLINKKMGKEYFLNLFANASREQFIYFFKNYRNSKYYQKVKKIYYYLFK